MLNNLISLAKAAINFFTEVLKDKENRSKIIIILSLVVTLMISISISLSTRQVVLDTMHEQIDSIDSRILNALKSFKAESDSIQLQEEYKAIELQNVMHSKLNGTLNQLGCEYILICQFHNNVSSLGGVQFIKFNVTYNVYKDDITTYIDIRQFQDIPISEYRLVGTIWNYHIKEYDVSELKSIDHKFYEHVQKYAPTVSRVVFEHMSIRDNRDGVIIYMFNNKTSYNLSDINNFTEEISLLMEGKLL